jgi:hypothetical protein
MKNCSLFKLNQRLFHNDNLSNEVTIEISTHTRGQHSLDIPNDDERERQIIRRTLDFIIAHSRVEG